MTAGIGFQIREHDLIDIQTENTRMIPENILDAYFAMRLTDLSIPNTGYVSNQFIVPKLLYQFPTTVAMTDMDGRAINQVQQDLLTKILLDRPRRLIVSVCRNLHYFLLDIDVLSNEIKVYDSIEIQDQHEIQILVGCQGNNNSIGDRTG